MALCQIQGWFYLLTGAWPLLHGHSFQFVTGFKTNFWLAQLVGALLALTGCLLISAARRRRVTPEIKALGAGSAAILLVADIVCVPLPDTTPIYWLDAGLEAVLLVIWLNVLRRRE